MKINIDKYEKWIAEALSYKGVPYKREDLNIDYIFSYETQSRSYVMCYTVASDAISINISSLPKNSKKGFMFIFLHEIRHKMQMHLLETIAFKNLLKDNYIPTASNDKKMDIFEYDANMFAKAVLDKDIGLLDKLNNKMCSDNFIIGAIERFSQCTTEEEIRSIIKDKKIKAKDKYKKILNILKEKNK